LRTLPEAPQLWLLFGFDYSRRRACGLEAPG
jgi:hypothetical protein